MSLIELSGIDKVYRTKEIETTALENVNLSVDKDSDSISKKDNYSHYHSAIVRLQQRKYLLYTDPF